MQFFSYLIYAPYISSQIIYLENKNFCGFNYYSVSFDFINKKKSKKKNNKKRTKRYCYLFFFFFYERARARCKVRIGGEERDEELQRWIDTSGRESAVSRYSWLHQTRTLCTYEYVRVLRILATIALLRKFNTETLNGAKLR